VKPGNPINFGADPLGNDDSFAAIQAAVDSDHAVDVTPGYYYVSQPIQIDRPKIVNLSQPLLEPFDIDPRRRPSRRPGPNVKFSHARLWTDQNINLFETRSPNVYFNGGTFDFQNVVGWDKACFYYPAASVDHNNRANGWGGGASDFIILGNTLGLMDLDGSQAGTGILFDFESQSLDHAYWTHMHFSGQVAGVDTGFKATPYNPGNQQWSNQFSVHLDADYTRQAIVNHSISEITVSARHQSRHIFSDDAEPQARASIESHIARTWVARSTFFDFGVDSGDITGQGDVRWKNAMHYNLSGAENEYPSNLSSTNVNKSINLAPETRQDINNSEFLLMQGGFENWIKLGEYFYWQDDNGKLRVRDRRPPMTSNEGQPASD